MEIKNKQIKEIYQRWKSIWEDPNLDLETRLNAFTIIKTIERIVIVYESASHLNQEDINDLFIEWNKNFMPILPEERESFIKKIKRKTNKKLP